jgi:prepilin-type N-terminal cleavage/methylation domain-containing protein/prepilin-type processing-associated H-X9-DG protein
MPSRQIFPSDPRFGRQGFTLVELLVVIAIIGVLIGLLLPAVQSAREAGRRSKCSNNLHNIVQAMATYETSNGSFPPGRLGCDAYAGSPCNTPTPPSHSAASGFLAILQQLDESPLYAQFEQSASKTVNSGIDVYDALIPPSTWNNPPIAGLLVRPPIFVCPSDIAPSANPILNPQTTTSSYALVIGSLGANPVVDQNGNSLPPAATEVSQKYSNNGPFIYLRARRAADIRDGLNCTMFAGEVIDGQTAESMNSWPLSVAYLSSMRSTNVRMNNLPAIPPTWPFLNVTISHSGLPPVDNSSVTGAFASRHPQGAHFAFGDGHVKYLNEAIDLWTYQALSTIAGSETVSSEY